jgi:hypothetical protein
MLGSHQEETDAMAESPILESAGVADLELRLEEATRSSSSGVRRFIEPAAVTLPPFSDGCQVEVGRF